MSFLKRIFGSSQRPAPVPETGESDADDTDPADVGIFSGLFVASPEAVERWDIETGLTPAEWPAVQFKRLDTVKIGTLESIVTRVPYDDIDQDELHDFVRWGESDGPWISRVRKPLVDALAVLEPDRVQDVAASWADTDEFKARPSDKPSRADIEGLAEAIEEMTALARTSRERGEPMFLMIGL